MTSLLVLGAVIVAFVEYKKAHSQARMTPINRVAGACVIVPPRYAVLQTIAGPAMPVWNVSPVMAGAPQGTSTLMQSTLPPNSGRIAVGWNSVGLRVVDPLAIPANKATQYSWTPTQYAPPVGAAENQNGCVDPLVINY